MRTLTQSPFDYLDTEFIVEMITRAAYRVAVNTRKRSVVNTRKRSVENVVWVYMRFVVNPTLTEEDTADASGQ